MGAGTTLGHHLLRLLVAPGRRRFEQHLGELESVQRARLNRWLSAAARSPEGLRRGVRADWSWEEFSRQMPVTGWSDYAETVQVQRERKQSLLFRTVDIGAELFAMAAVCSRALRDSRKGIGDGSAMELADGFCRHARRRIEALFDAIASNDDAHHNATSRKLLSGRYTWLEDGIVPAPHKAQK